MGLITKKDNHDLEVMDEYFIMPSLPDEENKYKSKKSKIKELSIDIELKNEIIQEINELSFKTNYLSRKKSEEKIKKFCDKYNI